MAQKRNDTEQTTNEVKSPPAKELGSKTNCIVCKKPARASSIYCSDSCILKHAQDSLGGNQTTNSKDESESGKSQEKVKSESRVSILIKFCHLFINDVTQNYTFFDLLCHAMSHFL